MTADDNQKLTKYFVTDVLSNVFGNGRVPSTYLECAKTFIEFEKKKMYCLRSFSFFVHHCWTKPSSITFQSSLAWDHPRQRALEGATPTQGEITLAAEFLSAA